MAKFIKGKLREIVLGRHQGTMSKLATLMSSVASTKSAVSTKSTVGADNKSRQWDNPRLNKKHYWHDRQHALTCLFEN